MERVKTLEEGKQLLAEFEALPDLDARLNWGGYSRLPDYVFRCVCGYATTRPMGIDDLRQIITKGWEWKLEHYQQVCYGQGNEKEGEEESEEESEED